MYRKELCLSLLNDSKQELSKSEDRADGTPRRTPRMKWHKVFLFLTGISMLCLVVFPKLSMFLLELDIEIDVLLKGHDSFSSSLNRNSGLSRTWIECGCCFESGRVLFSYITASVSKKKLEGLILIQGLR